MIYILLFLIWFIVSGWYFLSSNSYEADNSWFVWLLIPAALVIIVLYNMFTAIKKIIK